MIPELRSDFNRTFTPAGYAALLDQIRGRCGMDIEFRVAETPIFVPQALLEEMAAAGATMAAQLISDSEYLSRAREAIPAAYLVSGETPRPHFLTADFALARTATGDLAPRLVEIQAFPSVFGYQAELCASFREAYGLDSSLGTFLSGLDEASYWDLLAATILGGHEPESVVLAEVDPHHQKTRADFEVTARRLGIAVVDIATLEPVGDKLHYRNTSGQLVPVKRIYNRAIADELIARKIQLPFEFTRAWDVEWAGHPNWYFLISKFSIPLLARTGQCKDFVPPAVLLSDFLDGTGRDLLATMGVPLPAESTPDTVYDQLLLKPLFSFAGKGIQFDPTQAQLEAIPPARRSDFLLQQRMHFVPNIETPHGPTQAEIRILYLWPDGGNLTPALALVRLGRGKMMGVDHNRDQEWVGASAAFFPTIVDR